MVTAETVHQQLQQNSKVLVQLLVLLSLVHRSIRSLLKSEGDWSEYHSSQDVSVADMHGSHQLHQLDLCSECFGMLGSEY